MKLSFLWLAIGSISLAIVAATQIACTSEPSIQAKDMTAGSEASVIPVARIGRANMASKTVLTAEFRPFQEVDVMAKVAGYVRVINVDLGDRVREGQVPP